MQDSEIYMKLLKEVIDNKYRLIQVLIEEGQKLYKLNLTVYNPFYAADFIYKVQEYLLNKEKENRE
ncbi:hypothetical protein [Caldisericum sp. AR60]|uniref:hypothetical protein n=1 Tax=Caldisericum sp. AR60 TaxID=3397852 RepID=UPI0039FD9019